MDSDSGSGQPFNATSLTVVPTEKRQEYERGIALLMTLTHERDMARADLNAANERIVRLQAEIVGRDTQVEALKKMLVFSEDQVRIKEAECSNLINTYRNERDDTMQDLADCRAKLLAVRDLVK